MLKELQFFLFLFLHSQDQILQCQHWQHLWWIFLCSLSTHRCELSTDRWDIENNKTISSAANWVQLIACSVFNLRGRSPSSSPGPCWRRASHPCRHTWWECWSGFSEQRGAQHGPSCVHNNKRFLVIQRFSLAFHFIKNMKVESTSVKLIFSPLNIFSLAASMPLDLA